MDLLNKKVTHTVLGIGLIIEQSSEYITVEFETKTSKFIYPNIFTSFIKAVDFATQDAILKEITENKEADEARKSLLIPDIFVKDCANPIHAVIPKHRIANRSIPSILVERLDEIRMTYFVFQGSTFDKECRGGYIWAPISNKSGNTFHHWDKLLDVRAGDIIFHGCGGFIQATSVAMASCYECAQPAELTTEDLWDDEGRKIDCAYTYMKHPIKTSAFSKDILRLSNVKYSPFDKNASGNMGYLFDLNRELAQIFASALVNQNTYVGKLDYIQDLLNQIK